MIPAHIASFDGARFIAAYAVVLFHLKEKIAEIWGRIPVVSELIGHGNLAVPFFFILSGVVLSHVYFEKYRFADHGRFIWLRFARLWPVHFAMTAAMVVLTVAWMLTTGDKSHPDRPWFALLPELLMVRSWYERTLVWNIPAWSIHCEWFAYLFLFPLCAAFIRPLKNPWILGLVGLSLLVIHPLVEKTTQSRIDLILCLFPAGCALYRLRTLLPGLKWGYAIVWLSLGMLLPSLLLGLSHLIYVALAGLIFGLSYEQGVISRILSTRAFVYGGQVSFALYMSHEIVLWVTRAVWTRLGVTGVLPLAITLLATLAGAVIVHHVIELPANKWLRKRYPVGSAKGLQTAPATG